MIDGHGHVAFGVAGHDQIVAVVTDTRSDRTAQRAEACDPAFADVAVNGNIGKGWVAGFGALRGAIASSIGHDSHNLIVAGDAEGDMAVAINHLIELQGGAVVVQDGRVLADLPLPVAGLMSDRSFSFVEARLRPLRAAAAVCGCTMGEPLLQLAFLPLPVIPHLKLTDRGYVAAGPDGLRLLPS